MLLNYILICFADFILQRYDEAIHIAKIFS